MTIHRRLIAVHRSRVSVNLSFLAIRAMASSTCRLLALPREIRNIIYSYLHHDITVDWGYKHSSFPIGGHLAVPIFLYNAPLLTLLRTCKLLFEEYRQAECFRKLTISVTV